MKSYMATTAESRAAKKWYVIDAEGKVLGRLASEIAMILMGKNKPTYTPHIDTGDYVIVINAEKVKLTGKKLEKNTYIYHTGYPGGRREIAFKKLMQEHPERLVEHAVKGMLPKSSLGRNMMKKLRVYRGAEHENAAQKPEVYEY